MITTIFLYALGCNIGFNGFLVAMLIEISSIFAFLFA